MSISSGSINSSRSLNGLGSSRKGRNVNPLDRKAPEWNLNQVFGREQETKNIQDHVDKQLSGTIVVKGLSGSGKSSLIESQHFEEDGWVFATGKYEDRRKREPYSALIDALNSIVDKWIINNENAEICRVTFLKHLMEEDLIFLKNILPKAFHNVADHMAKAKKCQNAISDNKLRAELKVESNSQPEKKSSSRTKCDGQCRSRAVNASFWRILSFFCETKPIVLFLDDIQWADQASLDVMEVLSSSGNTQGFLLVLSYREEEVAEGDPVSKCLDFIEREGQRVKTIHVTDLDVGNTNVLVSSLLQHESERTLELSKVIYNKTAGNPFFVVQFIQMLRNEGCLSYNFMTLKWEWGDTDKLNQLAYVSDNVADVIAASMSRLSRTCHLVITTASCLGKVIPIQVMIEYVKSLTAPGSNVCEDLKEVRVDGLKELFDDAVKFGIVIRLDDENYMWAHDKLQHVAYSMIPNEYVQKCHKSLGEVLWKMHKSSPENEWMLYMAADQLNQVTDVIDDDLSHDIARLSFQAAQLSISKAALFPALDMLRFAVKHLNDMEDAWATAYELSLDVFSTLAEISLGFDTCTQEALDAAIQVDQHAKILEDKIRAQVVMIRHQLLGGSRDYAGGIDSIREILLDYGVKFSRMIIPGQRFLGNRKIKARLNGTVKSFLTLRKLDEHKLEDKRTENILNLLAYIVEYTGFTGSGKNTKTLNYYATIRMLNISIEEGTTSDTAMAIAAYGSLLGKSGLTEEAQDWFDVASELIDSIPRKPLSRHSKVKTWCTFGMSAASVPFHDMLEPILELNRYCLKSGDIQQGFMSWFGYSYAYISVGLPLDPLCNDLMSFSQEAKQFRVPATIKVLFPIFRQTIDNLKTLYQDPTLLKGDLFDQEEELKQFKDTGLRMTLRDINSFRLMIACIYQDWDAAEGLVYTLEPFLNTDRWHLREHQLLVYMGFASFSLAGKTEGKKRQKFRQLGKKIIRIFKDRLKNGSADALPIVYILEAIKDPSKERFDEARRTTARLGLLHYEAFVYENAGLFFMQNDRNSLGEYHISEAAKLYVEWGANGKATQMCGKYDFLSSSSFQKVSGGNIHGIARFSTTPLNQMRVPITSGIRRITTNIEEKESHV